ncbi:MAG: hypothetical protein M3220_18420 [Chloroflexota bacterium]|nr:hypothetical protein [Chloroflexota bacterium]
MEGDWGLESGGDLAGCHPRGSRTVTRGEKGMQAAVRARSPTIQRA